MKIPSPFTREDLYCVLWHNSDRAIHSNARPYQTFSVDSSTPLPYVFPIEQVEAVKGKKNCKIVNTPREFYDLLEESTKNAPLLMPLLLAEEFLGWTDFEFCHFFGQF